MSSDIGGNSTSKNNDESNDYSEPSKKTVPIKIVDKGLFKLKKKVVNGTGVCSTAIAVPQFKHGKKSNRVWRILLDSGSDGDLLFVHQGRKE